MNRTQYSHLTSKIIISEKKAPRNEELQLLTLVDKCTQILRDDRIYLRSKIKEGDPQIIALFRTIKKPLNMQLLQINLRKFLQQAKSHLKMEQITKFKENLCEGLIQLEKTKKDNLIKKKLSSISKKKLIPNTSQYRYDLSSQKSPALKQKSHSFQNFLNQVNKNIIRNSISKKSSIIQRSSFLKEKTKSTSNLVKKSFSKPKPLPYKQYPSFSKQNLYKPSISQDVRLDTSIVLNKTFNAPNSIQNENHNERMSLQSKRRQTFQSQQKSAIHDYSISTSKNNSNIKNKLNNYQESTLKQSHEIFQSKNNEYIVKNHQNLFTPSDILLDYRKCIQQPFDSNKFTEKSFDKFIRKHDFFDFSVNTKSIQVDQDTYTIQHPNITANDVPPKIYEIARFPSLSDKDIKQEKISQKIIDQPSNLLGCDAEGLFQLIFLNNDSFQYQISLDCYKKILSKHFSSIQTFLQFFSLADKNNDQKINALELGSILQKKLKIKHNLTRDIYGLIDIEKNGYFTWEVYERFLNHIIQPNQQNYLFLHETAKRLFQDADKNKNGKVEYWGLYLTKESREFEDFTQYLQGFQFQIQI